MEGALDEAEVVLEFQLATFGNNVGSGNGAVTFEHGGASTSSEGRKSDCPH
jgi:hypothetical protein